MIYGSVCSGIEAATVAWAPLGWQCAFVAEVEPYCCALLAQYYPNVPNLGDMMKADWTAWAEKLDVLVGGTPCQAFSVAGLRRSLDDERGNLTLEFVRAANIIRPRYIVWENVPGVLSTKDNAFGCFLGALVGADSALVPARGQRWTDAGVVDGPTRSAAWRIQDAQYHGLAQRRERVFVVASAGDGAHPGQILFESNGLQRHSPPRRETEQRVAPTTEGRAGRSGPLCANGKAAGSATQQDAESGMLVTHGFDAVNDTVGSLKVGGGKPGQGYPAVVTPDTLQYNGISHASTQETNTRKILQTLRQEVGEEAFTEWGLGVLDSLQPAQVLQSDLYGESLRCQTGEGRPIMGNCSLSREEDLPEGAMRALWETKSFRCPPQGPELSEQLTRELGTDLSELPYAATPQGIFLSSLWEASEGIRPLRQALSALQEAWRSAFGERQSVRPPAERYGVEPTTGMQCSGVRAPAPCEWLLRDARSTGQEGNIGHQQRDSQRSGSQGVANATYAVRRLLPVECELLQGFPRDYTLITYRGKPAADGPRYRALGNSMAVPVMRFLGIRIQEEDQKR